MNEIEQVKKEKEIEDIIHEQDKIQRLLNDAKWDELQTYLQKLNEKYFAETFFYNKVHPNPPKDIKENAENCISFLHALLETKTADQLKS